MPDYRTKRQKLQAMADQTASPNEAAVARAKLEEMDPRNGQGPPLYLYSDDESRFQQRAGRKTTMYYEAQVNLTREQWNEIIKNMQESIFNGRSFWAQSSNHFSDDK